MQNQKPYLIPIKKEFLQAHGIFHSVDTLYQYHSKGKQPEWFHKIGGRLLLDVNAYFNKQKEGKNEKI